MAKIEKSFLTPKWLVVKEMYETGTNGSDKFGDNFQVDGELNELASEFTDILGELTRQFGWDCVIEGVKMDLWKERIWSLIENAGLLPEIAWRDDLETDRLNQMEVDEDDIYDIDLDEMEKEIYNS
tara:strand:+ start:2700 stop:3077 length:378 start_codon:yes stop_codon:yes gene_type:complete